MIGKTITKAADMLTTEAESFLMTTREMEGFFFISGQLFLGDLVCHALDSSFFIHEFSKGGGGTECKLYIRRAVYKRKREKT